MTKNSKRFEYNFQSESIAMKIQRMALLGLGLIAAGCARDKGPFLAPDTPLAYVRWVNAVTDTNSTDFKFVDLVEGSAYYQHGGFRSISSYQGANAGARHVKVFSVDPLEAQSKIPRIEIVTQVLKDTTITLEAGKYYTFLMTGTARNNKTYINVIVDDRSAVPSSTQIAVHAINAAADLPSVDVYALATATTPISGAAAFAGLTLGKGQAYALRSTGAFAFAATASGSTSALAAAAAPAGAAPASASQSALGGFSIGGSYLTAFIFPAAVSGSLATGATPAVVWIQDNAPIP